MRLYVPRFVSQIGQIAATSAVKRQPKGTVIFLHGSCDSGAGMKTWLDKILKSEFKFSEFNILYPSAPFRPYTLLNGQETRIWYDRLSLCPQMPEDIHTIESCAHDLQQFIMSESKKTGISTSQMVLGGFSMGGGMALHIGYRFCPNIAGVFAISSFLAQDSVVYQFLKQKDHHQNGKCSSSMKDSNDVQRSAGVYVKPTQSNQYGEAEQQVASDYNQGSLFQQNRDKNVTNPNTKVKLPLLLMSQGLKDPIAKHQWAKSTFCKLRDLGVDGQFISHSTTAHSIHKTQLSILHEWINQVLTPASTASPR